MRIRLNDQPIPFPDDKNKRLLKGMISRVGIKINLYGGHGPIAERTRSELGLVLLEPGSQFLRRRAGSPAPGQAAPG